MPKRILITGASGFVGRQLVPRLVAAGCEILLVGRSAETLTALFPGIRSCTYQSISEEGQDFDVVLHLAVLNNDATATADEFRRVNVDLLKKTLAAAKRAGVSRFVNVTTFHALDEKPSEYAHSKRAALDVLDNEKEISVINVFYPPFMAMSLRASSLLSKRFQHSRDLPRLLSFPPLCRLCI